jgi:hypothetical protein
MSLHLAYDGSINGDWVARYAIRLAALRPPRQLRAIHVETGEPTGDRLRAKLRRIEEECRAAEVALRVDTIPIGHNGPTGHTVYDTLVEAVPPGPDSLLVCGMRLRRGRRGHLAGTISEKLIGRHRSSVVAVRVVQPGLLGAPHDVLLAVLGPPAASPAPLALVRWLAPEIRRLHILRAIKIGRAAFRALTPRRLARFRRDGLREALDIEKRLIEETGLDDRMIDAGVRVTDDWVRDVIIHASRHKSQLICAEAPRSAPVARLFGADPIERLLADAPCDVALFRGA